jgi:class 3 adenylate cyclase
MAASPHSRSTAAVQPRRSVVAVVFCDLVGSTALLEHLGEAGSDELRRDLFVALRRTVTGFGGTEIKSQGDGLMVAFAVPSDAAACAVAMQGTAARLAARDTSVPVAIRVGASVGEATAEDGDWFGRPVVEAARLCAAAAPGQSLASAALAAVLDPAASIGLVIRSLGALPLKGFTAPLPTVELLRGDGVRHARPLVVRPPALEPAGLLPFTGSGDALAAFAHSWGRVQDGGFGAYVLHGPPGSGKTRTIAEAVATVAVDAEPLAASATGDPFADALRWWVRSTPPSVVVDRLGRWTGPLAARIPAVALHLAGLRLQEPGVVAAGEAGEEVDPLVGAVAALADPAAPVVFVVDDAERLLSHDAVRLADLISLAPAGLLVAIAHRAAAPGTALAGLLAKLGGRADAVLHTLRPWSPEQTAAAVAGVLHRQHAGLDVHRAAEGVPGRVVDLVSAARARGSIDDAVATGVPYKGLVPYGPQDEVTFFGRDDDIAFITARTAASEVLAVVGPSGSGKSSLLRAGLIPAVRRGALAGSEAWAIHLVDAAIGPAALDEALDVVADAGPQSRHLLVVDQAEDLLPAPGDEIGLRRIDRLLDAADTADSRVHVVIGLRADRYGDVTVHPRLAALVEQDHVLLGPLRPDQVRSVVHGPAERAGLRVETGLADMVLQDMGNEPGALPMVSQALLETWRRRRGPVLTIADYRDAGGVRGAIAASADELFERLDARGQRAARRVLTELADISPSGDPVRRAVHRDALAAIPGGSAVMEQLVDGRLVVAGEHQVQIAHEALLREWPRLRSWLEADRERIRIRRGIDELAATWDANGRQVGDLLRGSRLEAAHEALVATDDDWPQLDVEFVQAGLSERDAQREAERRQLEVQRRQNRRLRALLSAAVAALVLASVAGVVAVGQRSRALDAAGVATAEQQRADDEAARAEAAAGEATAAARTAEARRLAAESAALRGTDPALALLTAVEAAGVEDIPETRGQLLSLLGGSPAVVRRLPFTGLTSSVLALDDERVAVLEAGRLWVIDLTEPGLPTAPVVTLEGTAGRGVLRRTAEGIVVVAGTRLVVLRPDGSTVREIPLPAEQHAWDVAVSPSGRYAALSIANGAPAWRRVVVIDVATGTYVRELATEDMAWPSGFAVDDDGTVADVSLDGTIRSWSGDGTRLPDASTAPDGRGAVFVDGRLHRWFDGDLWPADDLLPGQMSSSQPVDIGAAWVEPSGTTAAVGAGRSFWIDATTGGPVAWTEDGIARVSASEERFPQVEIDPGVGPIRSISLSPTGRRAVVSGLRQVVVVAADGGSILDRQRIPLPAGDVSWASPSAVSPSGEAIATTRIATAGDPAPAGTLITQVVGLADGRPRSPVLVGRAGFVDDTTLVVGVPRPDGLYLSEVDVAAGTPQGEDLLVPGVSPQSVLADEGPGGRLIVGTGPQSPPVYVQRGVDGETAAWRPLPGAGGMVTQMVLRPGVAEAISVGGGQLRRIDLTTGEGTELDLGLTGASAVAVDPVTGELFVGADDRLHRVDLDAGSAPTLVTVVPGQVRQIAVRADGRQLAVSVGTAGSAGSALVLVDAESGDFLPFGPARDQFQFLPDGSLLVIDRNGVGSLEVATPALVRIACDVAGRVQTPQEWRRYGPAGQPYAPACAGDRDADASGGLATGNPGP